MAAWEIDGGWIGGGVSVNWTFWWDGSGVKPYKGIQAVQARPEPQRDRGWEVRPESVLRVTNVGLRMTRVPKGYEYSVTVENVGSHATLYTLVGKRVDD
jgi:hypothetical protein